MTQRGKDSFTLESIKLRRKSERYDEFSKAMNLPKQNNRTMTYGYNRSVSQKKSWAVRKVQSLEGIKTPDGIEIKETSLHAIQRMNERKVDIAGIRDALANPINQIETRYGKDGKPSRRYVGEKVTVNVNPDTGVIVTTWKTGSKVLKKMKR